MGDREFLESEYFLKYKDEIVLQFDTKRKTVQVFNCELIPLSIKNRRDYGMIVSFCSDRMLMTNREYCKEILVSCGIDDQSDINICILSRALSFRDNYWICSKYSEETWEKVNLYKNEFSLKIADVALTGNLQDINQNDAIGDQIYTGELTSKGIRAKCFVRTSKGIVLIKYEKIKEILSEIIVYYLAKFLNIPCSRYIYSRVNERDCSVCQIKTSESLELVPYRDMMSFYDTNLMTYNSLPYLKYMQIDPIGFLKMHILDYITLNTDRNRDNFGALVWNGKTHSLYPLFDHDSCFKGKSTKGLYFPTGLSYAETLRMIKLDYTYRYNCIRGDIANFQRSMLVQENIDLFLKYKSYEEYCEMMNRVAELMQP